MRPQVTLEGSEVRRIVALFLGVPEEQVKPLRYNFAIEGMSAEEIAEKLKKE